MGKPRCFKQTNTCSWFRYIFAVIQFIFLLLIFLCENIVSLLTFILSLGCKYYTTQWQWYTALNVIDSHLIDDINLHRKSSIKNTIQPATIALSPIHSGSASAKQKVSTNPSSPDSTSNLNTTTTTTRTTPRTTTTKICDGTIRVLTQNLWIHYLAPSPCKSKRLEAFINYLKDLKRKNELYDVLILQEIFGIRFGLWIRCSHLRYLVFELRKLGYIYHTKPSGILPYFGQNGGVMIFSLHSMNYNNIEKYRNSDERMLRKGYAIATIKIDINQVKYNRLDLQKQKQKHSTAGPVIPSSSNDDNNNNKNTKRKLFSKKKGKTDNTPTIQENEVSNGTAAYKSQPRELNLHSRMNVATEEADDEDDDDDEDEDEDNQDNQDDESNNIAILVENAADGDIIYSDEEAEAQEDRKPIEAQYYYVCCGTGHCDPYRVNIILSQIEQFANAMLHRFDAYLHERKDNHNDISDSDNNNNNNNNNNNSHNDAFLDMIVGGDFNTRNLELQQGLRRTFAKIGNGSISRSWENDDTDGSSGGSTQLTKKHKNIDKNRNRHSGETTSRNGMQNVWEMSLYAENENKLSNVTYRSIYITKCKLWLSILSCGLIELPSLENVQYKYGHCLDHILTNIDENRIVDIRVVDTRWKNVFVSDHMGVMMQFRLP